jgi:hypothetical protein
MAQNTSTYPNYILIEFFFEILFRLLYDRKMQDNRSFYHSTLGHIPQHEVFQ